MEEIKFEKVPVGIFDKVKTNKEEFVEKFIDELEELFPDTVKDGKVDFQALLERFGEYEDRDERYELTWVGKSRARQESFEDIVGKTLKYIEEDSKNPETTENLYIEGDNLEVLKLLRNSYYGKIKMIYIDPPYNTGNDFVYKDDFTMTKEEYDKLKGDVDEYGNRLVKNSADSGRYHSNWLNMMYPRLQVAKNLLTDDGVIFISIDDNEVHNMRKICDEIFGEENFATSILWRKKTGSSDVKGIATITEYALVYVKNSTYIDTAFDLDYESYDVNRYRLTDEYVEIRGKHYIDNLDRGSLGYVKSLDFGIIAPDGILAFPNGRTEQFNDGWRWTWGKEKVEWGLENGFIVFKKNEDAKCGWRVYRKNYLNVNNEGKIVKKGAPYKNLITDIINTKATIELNKLLEKGIFQYSKPVDLIKQYVKMNSGNDCIILDFFSGSATTAHAVMDLNAEDNGNRKYIMVQLPEPTEENSTAHKEGYENICEIGKERIRRAGDKILEDNKDKEGIENLDTGFKVFRVEDTNFKRIKEIEREDLEDKYKSFSEKDQEDFNPHFTDLDVVYELMLRRQDVELTEEIKKLDNIGDRTYIVGDTMLVCLEEKITEEMVDKIGNIDTDLSWIVLRDSAFDDDCDLKVNTTRKLRTIIKESRKKDQKIYWI